MDIRTGLGWDNHRIAPGRPLILGGVRIPSEIGLEGHSDADVLAHAITDAILGAAALGRYRNAFPDTDPRWKGADSLQFLRHACELARAAGLPHLEYRFHGDSGASEAEGLPAQQFASTLAQHMGVPLDRISVKFKTSEKVGPVGEGRSAEAQAIVTLVRD